MRDESDEAAGPRSGSWSFFRFIPHPSSFILATQIVFVHIVHDIFDVR